ncbi:MAG: 2-oxoacid:acceptor oxidoreductase family protein [Candidatus Parcubacteria bacterium]|nr:2-oxoacid:acceptor oxidoreductase family protein [Candidatus Parcubacteria bacterium]
MIKNYNIIIVGYGGQGVITLAEILAQAALAAGLDVKQAELHGLAQRGGSLECHLRIGGKVLSPLIGRAEADLIIGLELLETLRACYYADPGRTTIIVNHRYWAPDSLKVETKKGEAILNNLNKFTKNLKLIEAEKLLTENNLNLSMTNTLMLAVVAKAKILPVSEEQILTALRAKIKPQFLAANQKIFNLVGKM